MILKLLFIQACIVILQTNYVRNYVIFAANLEDFRDVAKRYIPGKLADQLADMAAKPAAKYHREQFEKKRYKVSSEEEYDSGEARKVTEDIPNPEGLVVSTDDLVDDSGSAPSQKERHYVKNQEEKIDFDKLVAKVKEKLLADYNFKLSTPHSDKTRHVKTTTEKVQQMVNYNYKDEVRSEGRDVKMKKIQKVNKYKEQNQYENYKDGENSAQFEITTKYKKRYKIQNGQVNDETAVNLDKDETSPVVFLESTIASIVTSSQADIREAPNYYEAESVPPIEDGNLFKEVDMMQVKDSYEDYVTPKRDDVFESDEKETQPTTKNKALVNLVSAKMRITDTTNPAPSTVPRKRQSEKVIDVKAKTENLMYDDAIAAYDDAKKTSTVIDVGAVSETTKKQIGLGTHLPKRATIKTSTPNYYANLPVIAERYNFEEPIPEKDREQEKLKYIGNPPGSINKKVKLVLKDGKLQ